MIPKEPCKKQAALGMLGFKKRVDFPHSNKTILQDISSVPESAVGVKLQYQCDFCGKSFKKSNGKESHLSCYKPCRLKREELECRTNSQLQPKLSFLTTSDLFPSNIHMLLPSMVSGLQGHSHLMLPAGIMVLPMWLRSLPHPPSCIAGVSGPGFQAFLSACIGYSSAAQAIRARKAVEKEEQH